jgi:hypothetical protein
MSPVRIVLLAAAALALAAPLASAAAPARESSGPCAAARMTGVQRRISEEAAKGQLIGFVNLTQPIYQLRLVDAVAWLDAERARRGECGTASAQGVSD